MKESKKGNFCRENQEHCKRVFRNVDKEWVLKKDTYELALSISRNVSASFFAPHLFLVWSKRSKCQ